MSAPVTLITGARKGIGAHLAKTFVERGHRVHGCSRKPVDEQLDGYTHHEADVSDEKAVRKMFAAIRKTEGRLDNLVNNAGAASMNHFLLTPLSTAERLMQTNFLGAFACSREAAKMMKDAGGGRIVNFTTVAVPLRLAGEAAYAASKAAVEEMTRVLAREVAEFGITVNAVGPTPIDTDLIRNVPEEKIAELLAQQAIHRMGTFDDVVNVVEFFLRPESAFVTGQTIYLGGV
jgi:3-oxoacyl-[acyl-carrier protein] reductase